MIDIGLDDDDDSKGRSGGCLCLCERVKVRRCAGAIVCFFSVWREGG